MFLAREFPDAAPAEKLGRIATLAPGGSQSGSGAFPAALEATKTAAYVFGRDAPSQTIILRRSGRGCGGEQVRIDDSHPFFPTAVAYTRDHGAPAPLLLSEFSSEALPV